MEDEANTISAGTPREPHRNTSRWGRTLIIAGSAVVVLAGVGAVAAKNLSFGHEHGMGRHMMHASMGGFAERRLERLFDAIDTTPEQEEKLKAIFSTLREQTGPVMKDFRESRGQAMDILGAATIDRAAAEKLRSDRIAAMVAASRTMTSALLDAAEILTAQQRASLVEHFKARAERHKW